MSRPARVLVTGASRGIGRAVAEALLEDGRHVVLVARDRARLEQLAEAAPGRAALVVADLTEAEGLARAAAAVEGVDGLVHAAGEASHAPLEAITDAQLDRSFALHVRAPLALSRAFAAQRRPGSIVLVASTLGLRAAPGTLVYSATKAALLRMAQALALELAPGGVRVNAVAPGVVDTDMVRQLRLAPDEAPPSEAERERRVVEQLEALRRLHPLGRLGTPREVAEAIVYLLDAEWVTGSTLTVDGGLTAG